MYYILITKDLCTIDMKKGLFGYEKIFEEIMRSFYKTHRFNYYVRGYKSKKVLLVSKRISN